MGRSMIIAYIAKEFGVIVEIRISAVRIDCSDYGKHALIRCNQSIDYLLQYHGSCVHGDTRRKYPQIPPTSRNFLSIPPTPQSSPSNGPGLPI